ncbi:IS66 family insertion sequence element accessory protein TnpB [Turicibacter bilis]|nr:IS66 family insertion sequence element accessory protein TnpB [Turicibacter bilis]
MCNHTDIGCGIHGLAGLIAVKYNLNLFNDALFLFCNPKKPSFQSPLLG